MKAKYRNILTAALVSAVMLYSMPAVARWTLPVANGGGEDPSPPSVQGYITDVSPSAITLKPDRRDGKASKPVIARLAKQTQFFTGYGGAYEPQELQPGLYVWVWYITENPQKAGNPPVAAVVMLWSTDPHDKPSSEVRWHHLNRK
jgi:hypothetical protein